MPVVDQALSPDTTEQQAVTVAHDITRNPASIWLSPICDDTAHHGEGRTWAAPAPDETCEDCSEPWVEYVRSDLASVSSASVEGWVPERFTLSERELDDECGCPEETWDTPFGTLNMHLTAGKPSNACLDNGDEGEWSIDLTRATIDDARTAFFAWSMIAASLPTASPEPVPATNQAGEVELRFWLIVHKPGNVPDRKGSWPIADIAKVLREFIAARPDSYLHVVTVDRDGVPEVEHGPEALQMADGRSMGVGRKHNARTLAAHIAALATQPATSQEGEVCALCSGKGFADAQCPVCMIAATPTPPTLSEDLREAALVGIERIMREGIHENDGPDRIWINGVAHEGPVADFTIRTFRKVGEIARAALAQVKAS